MRAQQELKELSARLVSAQEEERRAISRELHDEVGQSLSALLMEAGNAAASVPQRFGRSAPSRRIHQEAGRGERQRHPQHDAAAAPLHARRFRTGAGARMAGPRSFEAHRPARPRRRAEETRRTNFPMSCKTCIYRVVQEALHNCARHSQARIGEGGGEAGARPRSSVGGRRRPRLRRPPRARPRPGRHGGARQSSGRRIRDRIRAGSRNQGRRGAAASRADAM